MRFITSMFVKAREFKRGQTMTEYALILAAIAVVVFATYQLMGQDIGSLVNKVNSSLTAS
ncbi:MAG TPA: Flp family type IVb pilin [Candidatus Binataceae bacterium]|nr:Flp family type IVb pilin [Candidatus Binataceae bacterium]